MLGECPGDQQAEISSPNPVWGQRSRGAAPSRQQPGLGTAAAAPWGWSPVSGHVTYNGAVLGAVRAVTALSEVPPTVANPTVPCCCCTACSRQGQQLSPALLSPRGSHQAQDVCPHHPDGDTGRVHRGSPNAPRR